MKKIKLVKIYPLYYSNYGDYESVWPIVDQSNWCEVNDSEFAILHSYVCLHKSDKYKLMIIEECNQQEALGMISDILVKAKKMQEEYEKKMEENKRKLQESKSKKKQLSIEEAKRTLEAFGFKIEKKEEQK